MKKAFIVVVIIVVLLAMYFYTRQSIITINKINQLDKSIDYTITIDGETFTGTKLFSDKYTAYHQTKTGKNIDIATTAKGFEITIYTNTETIITKEIFINL